MSSAYPTCHLLNKSNNHLLDQLIHMWFVLYQGFFANLWGFSRRAITLLWCVQCIASMVPWFYCAPPSTSNEKTPQNWNGRQTHRQTDRQLRILNREDCPRKSTMKVLMSKFDRLYVWRLEVLSRSGAFDWGCAAEWGGAGRLDN